MNNTVKLIIHLKTYFERNSFQFNSIKLTKTVVSQPCLLSSVTLISNKRRQASYLKSF